jgi:hypothetical protein
MMRRSRRLPETGSRTARAIVTVSVLLAALALPAAALAEEVTAPAVPHWSLESRPAPTNLQREGEGTLNGEGVIAVAASNLGDATATGQVEIVDRLPPGIVATSVAKHTDKNPGALGSEGFSCAKESGPEVVCSRTGTVVPYERLELIINVHVKADTPTKVSNEVTVSGGGAVPASSSLTRELSVNGAPTTFGVEEYALTPETATFEPDAQAGSHPFQFTTVFDLNAILAPDIHKKPVENEPSAPSLPRNLSFRLPPGLVGNPNVVGNSDAVQQCSDLAFGTLAKDFANACPNNSVVGTAAVTINNPAAGTGYVTYVIPVFNLVPAAGEPAKFGFSVAHTPVVLDTSVRTGEDYGATVTVHYASQVVQVLGSRVTFWGSPADPRHNSARGWDCLGFHEVGGPQEPCHPEFKVPGPPAPFLTLPTSCGPLITTMEGDAWNASELEAEGKPSKLHATFNSAEPPNVLAPKLSLAGCGDLPFDPSIEVEPDKHEASTPTGMTVKVNVPQGPTLESALEGGHAERDILSTRFELPIGLQASPAAATGLGSCSVEQAGFNGSNTDTGSTLETELGAQLFTPAAASCPESAKIGTVNIKTPLLEGELIGGLYLANQDTSPFVSPLVLYIIAEDKRSGVLVKLAGEVQINAETGQLITNFRNTPESPFETLTLHLTNGDRASQETPAFCGEYHATAAFMTTSLGVSTVRESNPAEFKINSGPHGTPCPGATLPFGPEFKAGSLNGEAGEYSPFDLTITKADGQQALESITIQLPPGMTAKIATLTRCPASVVESLPTVSPTKPACPAESKIGVTATSSGLGGEPVTLPGDLYLTEGVNGAPFGLLAVTHAQAGPFDLGFVSILSTININETTAAVTVKTVKAIPKRLDGVPVELKQVHVSVNLQEFQLNPTSCGAMAITGALTGWEGANDPVSYPFQTSNCLTLPFKPLFTAATSSQTSKTDGASLQVKVDYPKGKYANIAKVETNLPIALPSRLETIQKACLDKVFESGPVHCPEASEIGKAIARTPILKDPLEGVAYLVSHGGRAFPDLEIVLKGENGIKIVLDGQTDIKKGITKTTFNAVPDAPVESFELNLPRGPHSALGTSVGTNLCAPTTTVLKTVPFTHRVKGRLVHSTRRVTVIVPEPLVIPTTITAQNGAVIHQTTPVVVSGCAGIKGFKAKALTRAQKLAKALKACKKKPKAKRAACEKQARKSYGPTKASSKKKK